MQGGWGASSRSRVLLQLVQRAGLGSCRPASTCCSGGEGLPESCCCADRTMSAGCSCICGIQPSPVPATLASGSLHQLTPLGLAIVWPQAHTCQTEAPRPGILCGPASLSPASLGFQRLLFLGGSSREAVPCRAALPLGVGAAERGRCQDRAICLSVSNRGRQAGYGQHQGWARASRLPGREAATMLSSTGTSMARAISSSVHQTQY